MKRLYVFILKSFSGPFLFTLLLSVFVLLMASIWRYIDLIAGRDLPIGVILEFFGYYAITTLVMAIPLAILLASIMTLGNMGERYELIAMKAAGISLFKVLKPIAFLVVLLSVITFYVTNDVVPWATFKFKSLSSDMANKNPEFFLKEGTFVSDMPNVTIKVEHVSKEDDGKFYDAIIYEKSNSGKILRTITAKSGKMKSSKDLSFMTIWLYDGKMYEENDKDKNLTFTRTSFDEYMVVSSMKKTNLERTEQEINKQDYRMLTYRQLDTLIDDVKQRKEDEVMRTFLAMKDDKYFKKDFLDNSEITVSNYKTLNVDSILKKMSISDRSIILSSAIGAAKSMEEYLQGKEDYYSSLQTYTAKAEEHWHQKFSWPIACIIFFLVGASLGAIVRKGGFGTPVLISILLFIGYYILSKYGMNLLVSKGLLPAFIGGWIGTIVFFPLGVWLMYKAASDSSLMDSEAYGKLWKNVISRLRRIRVGKLIPFKKSKL